jgi:hypothetical protein
MQNRHLSYVLLVCRPAFWIGVGALLYLSLVPGTMRPHTGASGHVEHFLAYAGTGLLFSPARSPMQWLAGAIGLSWLSGGLEIAQLWIPGRTGEMAGFVWSSAGAWLGLFLSKAGWQALLPKP